jgi:hypothetical protein
MLTFGKILIFITLMLPFIIISAVYSITSFSIGFTGDSFLSEIPNMPSISAIPGIPGEISQVSSFFTGFYFLLILVALLFLSSVVFRL